MFILTLRMTLVFVVLQCSCIEEECEQKCLMGEKKIGKCNPPVTRNLGAARNLAASFPLACEVSSCSSIRVELEKRNLKAPGRLSSRVFSSRKIAWRICCLMTDR